MGAPANLIIFGASARAAAFSALRAGLRPWCGDLFADADLRARCAVAAIPSEQYPEGFQALANSAPEGPWMYTGGLENHDTVVHAISRERKLWGNGQAVLEEARSPVYLAKLLQDAGLPHPEVFYEYPDEEPSDGEWLVKPLAAAGGIGIRRWTRGKRSPGRVYLQEYIEGEPCSAVYVGDGQEARLLGVTAQLIGESRLHAGPFRYCGSIGPLMPDKRQWSHFMRLGNVITAGCKLRGLFGIDCILADDVPYPVEVNPRYPASVEIIEHASETSALALHAQVFDYTLVPAPISERVERGDRIIGKAILFAWMSLLFPADGPWMESLRLPREPWDLPAFADIPQPGAAINVGRPILTFFASASSVEACKEKLWQIAADLDRCLFARA